MAKFELPKDFTPDFEKDYAIAGNQFSIQVQAYGIVERRWSWVYSILVKGNRIECGVFYWDPEKRNLTNENVCNHLASFWGHNEAVKEAQKLPESFKVRLDQVVEKCARFMFTYFMTDPGAFDYDILSTFMNQDGWTVILRPNPPDEQECILTFHNDAGSERGVEFAKYILDRVFFTVL